VSDLCFRRARVDDAAAVAELVNLAYRGESSRRGWTTEADLLDGRRTTPGEVRHLIETHESQVLLCLRQDELLGSVHLEREGDDVHIGMFVIRPEWQGNGLGKQLLHSAEGAALDAWPVKKAVMHVITCRHELIAFYLRRGYMRTGVLRDFPENPSMWTPRVTGLQLEVLEKRLTRRQGDGLDGLFYGE